LKVSLPAPCVSFLPPKNSILPLLKNSVRRNRNFSNGKFRFLETEIVFQGQKKFGFMKGKTGNSGGEKES
jgi:hypothetical protein